MKNKDIQKKIISEVEKQLKTKVVNVKTPPQGMESEVFFAIDRLGNEYAVKYGSGAIGDVLAYELLKENRADIPVPKLFGTFLFKNKAVAVLEKINFPLLDSISADRMHRYIPSMIRNLKKIHQIRFDKPGFLADKDRNQSWKEIMLSKFIGADSNLNWEIISTRKGLDKKLIMRSVENIIKQIGKTYFTDGPYSFLHADFNQKNLFIDPNSDEITAIVDWSESLFGDPIYDFARIRMYIWHFNLQNNALEAYDKLLSFTPEQKHLEELYWLSRVIEYLAYYSEELNEFNTGRIKLHQDFLRLYKWEV